MHTSLEQNFEAGANHVIEALQCGLPVMYFKNSGSIEEQVKKKIWN